MPSTLCAASGATRCPVQVADTSIIVRAAITTDPQERELLQGVIANSPSAVAHVLAESYATLTALPPPFRLSPVNCFTYLSSASRATALTLSSNGYLRVLQLLADHGVASGAIYDCLIAETAREHDATVMSLDQRAVARYSLVGASYQLV